MRRGRTFLRVAFILVLVPAFVGISLAAGLWPDFVPTILFSQLLLAVILVMCYRGDPWARWILIAFMAFGVLRAGAELFGEDYPVWIVAIQTAYSAAIIALLQTRATRAFLEEQRSKLRRFAR